MNDTPVLKVQGEGAATAQPDRLVLKIRMLHKDREYALAIARLNAKTELLREAIESVGLNRSDLKTTDFRVDADHKEDKQNNRIFDGFTAKHRLQIVFPLDKELANKVFRALSKEVAGAEFGIDFDVSDRESLKNRAIEAAVKNAKARAELLAKAAGVSLGQILRVDYGFEEIRVSSQLEYCLSAEIPEHFNGPDIEAGELTCTDHVTMTWAITTN